MAAHTHLSGRAFSPEKAARGGAGAPPPTGGGWGNTRQAAHLGYQPKDSSEVFRAKVEAQPAPAADDPAMVYQGGAFVAAGPFD